MLYRSVSTATCEEEEEAYKLQLCGMPSLKHLPHDVTVMSKQTVHIRDAQTIMV